VQGELPFIRARNRRLPTIAGLEELLGKNIRELEAPLYKTAANPVAA
jgi:hypothetical protein